MRDDKERYSSLKSSPFLAVVVTGRTFEHLETFATANVSET